MARSFSDEGVKLVWLTTVPAILTAIPLASFTAGKDLSDYAVAGESEFRQTGSDSVSRRAYSDKGKVDTPTLRNATGKGVFFRDLEITGLPTINDPLSLFNDRQVGVMIKRKGVPEDTAWAIGQEYEFFKFQADDIGTINDADGDYESIEVNFRFKGDVGFGLVVA